MSADQTIMPSLCALPAYGLGRTIAAVHGQSSDSGLALWATLLCAHLQDGRVYLDINNPFAGLEVINIALPLLDPPPDWLEVVTAGQPVSGGKPVVQSDNRLWLARYYHFNNQLQSLIADRRESTSLRSMDEIKLRTDLQALFPPDSAKQEEYLGQLLAAASLVDLPFGLLTGGPGTGKTTSLTKLLLLWLRQVDAPASLAPILLLAPTGKAAARLRQSMSNAINKLRSDLSGDATWIPLLDWLDPNTEGIQQTEGRVGQPDPSRVLCMIKTQTIHKALSVRALRREGQGPFWQDANNPLQASIVIVDEVSMVDLALMTRLVEAVPATTPLLFVGDTEQLESVEAGFVLPEIAAVHGTMSAQRLQLIATRTGITALQPGSTNLPCKDHAHLTFAHRYKDAPLIGELAQAINSGNVDGFIRIMKSAEAEAQGIQWFKLPEGGRNLPPGLDLRNALMGPAGYGKLTEILKNGAAPDPQAAVTAFDNFRVLCAIRKGPDGLEQWNKRLQQWITGSDQGNVAKAVMITTNDPVTGLCNGDTGLLLPTGSSMIFHSSDRLQMPASRLPATEPAWAITIHKSQGSEYDAVAVVLPREGGERLLQRRLLYTAVTRAKKQVFILATEKALRETIASTC
ncbi:MAG: AAA family ATPase [bacterium]